MHMHFIPLVWMCVCTLWIYAGGWPRKQSDVVRPPYIRCNLFVHEHQSICCMFVVKIFCMLTILYNDGAFVCSAKFASIYIFRCPDQWKSVQLYGASPANLYICKMLKSCSVWYWVTIFNFHSKKTYCISCMHVWPSRGSAAWRKLLACALALHACVGTAHLVRQGESFPVAAARGPSCMHAPLTPHLHVPCSICSWVGPTRQWCRGALPPVGWMTVRPLGAEPAGG
jgi:hypothetical protein